MMKYKGYVGEATYDDEAKLLHGEVIGMRDVVTFQSDDIIGLQQAFEESIDDYLDFCEEEGVSPDKPYSGKFQTRISPELHRAITLLSKERHTSVNGLVECALINEIKQGLNELKEVSEQIESTLSSKDLKSEPEQQTEHLKQA